MRYVDFDGRKVIPSKIVCVGMNYVEHIEELAHEVRLRPVPGSEALLLGTTPEVVELRHQPQVSVVELVELLLQRALPGFLHTLLGFPGGLERGGPGRHVARAVGSPVTLGGDVLRHIPILRYGIRHRLLLVSVAGPAAMPSARPPYKIPPGIS